MISQHKFKIILFSIVTFCTSYINYGQTSVGSKKMESDFKTPPNSAKPKTWMHAMSGNMSKEGMTKDLEAIAAAGEGGILLFNIANTIPYGNVAYNSEEHHNIIKHTAKECERLNLSFGVHNCDGWSSSGGPWITPEQSMKMVCWSETVADGGKKIEVKLAQPTKRAGFYKDIAVVAYPSLDTEIIDAEIKPVVTSSDKSLDINLVTDNLINKSCNFSVKKGTEGWILFDFGKPHTIQSAYLSFFTRDGKAKLESSNDGENFTFVKDLREIRTSKTEWNIDDQFDPVTARYFRIKATKSLDLLEVNLRATRQFDNYLKYTGYGKFATNVTSPFKKPEASMVINKNKIINLTTSLGADGVLRTTLPKGKWTIMRFGMTSTGAMNAPASKWGKGLECDKFSREAYKTHFDAFCKRVVDDSKKDAPNALQYLEIDSYEMGGQNWTDGFENIFKKEKGYDIIPFLPMYAGRYVESAEAVTGFTYDINDLYCNLMTKNYFGYFTELCNERGLKSYVEPYGGGPVNTLDIAGKIDLPMTEFWVGQPQSYLPSTVSGAHIYGKTIISAESFTARPELNWKMHPALAKASGDEAWIGGVNEFMFHRFVHQANTHVKPGLTMGQWGSHMDRTQTWWMNAGKAWFNYIARGSYLLRQGYPVADVLFFVGDGPHKGSNSREKFTPKIPNGINFDSTNSDVLVNRLSIKDKSLVLPEGNAYRYLILKDIDLITLPTLQRIKTIVDAGIPVIGKRPKKLAGYQNSSKQQEEFEKLCDYIWSQKNVTDNFDFKTVQSDFEAVGQQLNFIHRKTVDEDIYFFNNKGEKAASYECNFRVINKIPELWNPTTGEISKIARFKSEGNSTKVWIKLESLESAFIVFRESAKGVTSVVEANDDNSYQLNSSNQITCLATVPGDYTIKLSNGKSQMIVVKDNEILKPIDISTAWDVEFLQEHDYKANVKFEALTDWKDNANEDIKYYSGTAIYRKSITLSKNLEKSEKAILDLGQVSIAAEVIVNGKNAGIVWIAPFTLDITDYLTKGENKLEIKVTNQWSNKLIGDERFPIQDDGFKSSSYNPQDDSKMPDWYLNNQPMPKGPRTTFDTGRFYKKGDPLMSSGLLGPVKIVFKQEKNIN